MDDFSRPQKFMGRESSEREFTNMGCQESSFEYGRLAVVHKKLLVFILTTQSNRLQLYPINNTL